MGAGSATALSAAPLASEAELARRAAVEIWHEDGQDGEHLGVGLALDVPERGPVILTCDHVVASLPIADVRVRFHDGTVSAVELDDATRSERDAAVLRFDEGPELINPRLHAPMPDWFHGPLTGTAHSPGSGTATFGVSLNSVERGRRFRVRYRNKPYELPEAFQISTDDSREGVSGSPVLCEDGVVGLVHAARDETPEAARVAYLGPITAWQEGLPELALLLEPFVTQMLRDAAAVYWARVAPKVPELHKPGAPDVPYLERPEDAEARRRLAQGALCVVGCVSSGKSRLVCQLLHDQPEAIVVMPQRSQSPPPDLTREADLRGRPVILVFENVHVAASAWRPLAWFDRFRAINKSTTLVVTSCNADSWTRVKQVQSDLFEDVGCDPVYLSAEEGRNLDEEEAWQLAQRIGMDRETFLARPRGTPGSILDDADAPPPPGETLPEGRMAGTAIRTVDPEALPAHIQSNLPAVSSTFVGRDADVTAVKSLLDRGALVTLTGPPGVGKTRLAIHTATVHAGAYPDGVWYAELSTVTDGRQLVRLVASSIGFLRGVLFDSDQALAEALRGHRALIVLNGPDSVRSAAARLAGRLTHGSPAVRVLVTAETRLDLPWESVLPLRPESEDAERLFLDRSGLPDGDRSRAEPLYEELAGNAAALEIAAAHVRESGLERAADTRDRRPLAAEHASDDLLRLAVLRSLEDVSEPEAVVFRRLGAMPDWFSLRAARSVTAGEPVSKSDVPVLLRRLVDRALVLIDERDDLVQRYRLLPSVRHIAAERLDEHPEAAAVRRRHAEHYLATAEKAARRLEGESGASWLARLEANQQHLRAALRWSIENDRSIALRLASALWLPCVARSNFEEARRWIDEILALVLPDLEQLPHDDAVAVADVVIGDAYLAYHQADYGATERALALADDVERRTGVGPAHGEHLNLRGLIARRRCRYDEALAQLEQAADVSRAEADMPRLGDRLNTIANTIRERQGDLERALALQEDALAIFARLGNLRLGAMAQNDLAYILLDQGHLEEARPLFEDSLETRRHVKDRQGVAQSLNGLGLLERESGDPEAAIRQHERALEMFQAMGDRLRVAETMEGLGLAAIQAGRRDEGRERLARAKSVRDQVGAPRPPVLVQAICQALEVSHA